MAGILKGNGIYLVLAKSHMNLGQSGLRYLAV
jgi:hypothetical protein